ncbi:MAG: MFS transporter [Thermoguttaceae bacterium]|jgi:MFS family permease
MTWSLYGVLSLMMFLEFAVWGAWAPVLAARLLGPLGMNGKQTGWIYATLPLASIFAPLAAGPVADLWIAAKWILVAAHLAGAVLLVVAARQEKFGGLFAAMFLYSICFATTLPLVNAVLFANLTDVGKESGGIFIWGPIAWALVGYFLTGWRWIFKTEGQGRDCLYLAAALSVLMGIGCLFLPQAAEHSSSLVAAAKQLLGDPNFLVFLVVSMAIAGTIQFYFLGTGRFLQDMGVSGKNVSASMGMAQAVQALATWLALMAVFLPGLLGFKLTLILGAACWLAMYAIYVAGRPRPLILASQGLHGLAYVFFIIVGQMYCNAVGVGIKNSIQALLSAATMGVGLFLGTQAAGWVLDRFTVNGRFQWRRIWLVPALVTLAGIVALAAGFANPP